MSEATILQLVEQLSLRVSSIEADGYKFWLPIVISILAVLISLYSVYETNKQAKKQIQQADEQKKSNTLQSIKANVDAAKSQIEFISMEIAPLKSIQAPTVEQKNELDIKTQVFDTVTERLLNAYNDGCNKFFKGQVNAQDFIDLYHQDIADYVNAFPNKFTGPLTRFDGMIKYFNERNKSSRA